MLQGHPSEPTAFLPPASTESEPVEHQQLALNSQPQAPEHQTAEPQCGAATQAEVPTMQLPPAGRQGVQADSKAHSAASERSSMMCNAAGVQATSSAALPAACEAVSVPPPPPPPAAVHQLSTQATAQEAATRPAPLPASRPDLPPVPQQPTAAAHPASSTLNIRFELGGAASHCCGCGLQHQMRAGPQHEQRCALTQPRSTQTASQQQPPAQLGVQAAGAGQEKQQQMLPAEVNGSDLEPADDAEVPHLPAPVWTVLPPHDLQVTF